MKMLLKNVVGFTKPKTIQCVLFQGLLVVSVLGFLIITDSKGIKMYSEVGMTLYKALSSCLDLPYPQPNQYNSVYGALE